jgi:hypothetical protein
VGCDVVSVGEELVSGSEYSGEEDRAFELVGYYSSRLGAGILLTHDLGLEVCRNTRRRWRGAVRMIIKDGSQGRVRLLKRASGRSIW